MVWQAHEKLERLPLGTVCCPHPDLVSPATLRSHSGGLQLRCGPQAFNSPFSGCNTGIVARSLGQLVPGATANSPFHLIAREQPSMKTSSFSTDLWESDINLLDRQEKDLAEAIRAFATETLGCRPHHRPSKASSDRQTIFKHPHTGKNCLVLSVVPSRSGEGGRQLRIDFFDRAESFEAGFGTVFRAPRTQWTKKGSDEFSSMAGHPSWRLKTFFAGRGRQLRVDPAPAWP